jgi:RNA polymerase sigma-70 factor (ECF subfamily)
VLRGFGTTPSRSRDRPSAPAVPTRLSDGIDVVDGGDELEAALTAARGGDEDAFAVVWRDLHPRLVRYLTVRGDDAPEDVAAETWVQVLRGIGSFEGGLAEFRAWLFTIARHRAIDQGRARTRRPTVLVADPAEAAGGGPTAPSAEQHAADNEDLARALRLVATLPPAQAEMVALRVLAGLDVADVAELLGKRPGTVRVGVHRALRTLARTAREIEWGARDDRH